MNSLQSGGDRILVRRAEGVQVLRRGSRAIAVSESGAWLELDPAEQRLWVELERGQTVQMLERKLPGAKASTARLYEAGLASANGRLRAVPPHPPQGETQALLPEATLQGLTTAQGTVLVKVGVALDDATFRDLVEAMRRGVVVVPCVQAKRADDFTEAFHALARRGFRLFRIEPSGAATDEEAVALADGMTAMAEAAALYARETPARFRISGLDGWLRRLCSNEAAFVAPHPRCERCLVHGLCRPDRAWQGVPGTVACTFARRVLEGLVWMLADQPDLPHLLAGGP